MRRPGGQEAGGTTLAGRRATPSEAGTWRIVRLRHRDHPPKRPGSMTVGGQIYDALAGARSFHRPAVAHLCAAICTASHGLPSGGV